MNDNITVSELKQSAQGYWPEIISQICHIDKDLLDGKHHPCPKCGGTDRFRMIDGDDGALFCNQCFNHNNGDGIAAIQWLLECDFKTAITEIEKFLGAKPVASSSKPTIVATYDYRDEKSDFLFQVVRFEPKSFRQRKPLAEGKWEWSVKGVRQVPYRLPELLRADVALPVFIVEGEKDVDNLTGLGITATTNAGGAGKWKAEHAECLRGRHVVILPDNDQPGQDHAQKVAESLKGMAASIKVLALPDLPPKGDVSDWIKAGGDAEQLLSLADAESEWSPSETVPLGSDKPELPSRFQPFPVAILPAIFRDYVTEAAAAIGCDPSFIAAPLLACFASAIGNTRRIQLKPSWWEPSVLWVGMVAVSGGYKTPALSLVTEFLEKLEEIELAAYEVEFTHFNNEMIVYERDFATWKHSKSTAAPPTKPKEPVPNRYVASDCTMEALTQRLLDAPRGLLCVYDELASWLASFDKYRSGGRGGDVATWLSMFNAKSIRQDRKSNGKKPVYIPRATVSIVGGIQPPTLRRALGNEYFDNGLAARILLVYPPPKPRKWREDSVSPAMRSAVREIFTKLLELDFAITAMGVPAPIDLALTPPAKAMWIDFYNRHGLEQAELEGKEAAFWSKLEGIAPRLALVLHLVRFVSGEAISETIDDVSMNAGIKLAEWFGFEGRRIYQMLGENEADRARRRLVEFIEQIGGTIVPGDLQAGKRCYRKPGEAEAALQRLVDAGMGEWVPLPTTDKGGRPGRKFKLHHNDVDSKTSMKIANDDSFTDDATFHDDESEVVKWIT